MAPGNLSAGEPGVGGGGGRHSGAGGGGTMGPDGGLIDPSLDPSGLRIEARADGSLCRLSPDGRELIVRVRNEGPSRAPGVAILVETLGTAYSWRATSDTLAPGASADLRFDRGALLGFSGTWSFTATLDPDDALGLGRLSQPGLCDDLRARSSAAMAALDTFYDDTTGRWSDDWWRAASTVEVAIEYARQTGDASYIDVIDTTFEKRKAEQSGNFLNDYYDDEGWWALAWINAYDLTHNAKYLDMAKVIFADMTLGWNADHCGGGVYWRKTDETKNAIPNELFLAIAARLHLRTPGDTGPGSYRDWAEREWAWFEASGMIGEGGLVVDGLNSATCEAGGEVFTYNQGVILGGLVDLFRITGDDALLDAAERIARAGIAYSTTPEGVLVETARFQNCTGDCIPFKGIFARNVAYLYGERPLVELKAFLLRQSDALWEGDRSADNLFGSFWPGPFDAADALYQTAALDALIGAVRVGAPNLALGGAATGSTPCRSDESADRATDGTAAFGSKWCSLGSSGQTLEVDLGARRYVVGFRVQHAGAGGEDTGWNTSDFEIETSEDGATWATAATVVGNAEDVTYHPILGIEARYVRLHITKAQTRVEGQAARIYELEVLGVGL
jgi:predicted alpha-1,6-mannanase (GH76 family)